MGHETSMLSSAGQRTIVELFEQAWIFEESATDLQAGAELFRAEVHVGWRRQHLAPGVAADVIQDHAGEAVV